MVMPIAFRILGQAASKSNRRQIVTINGRPTPIKSKEALAFEHDALRQIPGWARQRIEGKCRITLRVFYANEQSDLDPSLIFDILQDRWKRHGEQRILIQPGVVRNDRQFREQHLYHGIDKKNPRTEVEIEPLEAQAVDMFAAPIGTMLAPLVAAEAEDDGLSF